MSKFMSHREMRAASKVVGRLNERLSMLENIVSSLMAKQNLVLGVDVETGEMRVIDKPAEEPTAGSNELEIREIPDDEQSEAPALTEQTDAPAAS